MPQRSLDFRYSKLFAYKYVFSFLQMTNPDTINHLTDFKFNTIDPITKVNYIRVLYLVSRMNAT